MAREYLKAVIENTIVEEKSEIDVSESCDDIDTETVSDSNHSMSLRSPGGPMRGRSVKEFEEQLSNLKKENFTLKLRIYFLEDRMGVNFNLDKENIIKKNVELMVEVENLRKEVQEKQDLLCEAVMAMDVEDEVHKKVVVEKEQTIAGYQEEIENLKIQLLDVRAENELLSPKSYHSGPSELFGQDSGALKDLQERIKSLEEELREEKQNNAAIQLIIDQNDSKIKSLASQLDEANRKLSYSDGELSEVNFQLTEARSKCQGLYKKLHEKSQILDELSSENDELRKRNTQMASDLSKERKRFDRLKASSEQQVTDLQAKLETSQAELKKGQELVVSKSPGRSPFGNTDADSFSVQEPPASPGSPQKDTLPLPTIPSPVTTPSSSHSLTSEPSGVDLMHIIEQLKVDRDHQHKNIVKLKAEQIKACKIIKSMIESRNKTESEIAALKRRNEELERKAEGSRTKATRSAGGSDVSSSSGSQNENSMDEQSGELLEHYKALTDELEEKNRILAATLHEKDIQMKRLLEEFEEMQKNNKEKEEHIVDLEFELLTVSQDKNVKLDDADSNEHYMNQLRQKEKEIELLNSKLQKRNCDLQGLVNKELWEKNREIEKLQKSKLLEHKDREIEKLQIDLKTKEEQLNLIKEKISELGIDIDIQGGGVNVEKSYQSELEKSEQLRMEANEVCTVLSRRLEELAVFLDSLLKQKSILGFLGNKENKRLRQIIDQSLDLSRSFTMSMMINPEQSLLQLSGISGVLNDTETRPDGDFTASRLSIIPTNISVTYRSHVQRKDDDQEDASQIIQTLREQIVNLKYELQLRDVELSKMNAVNTFTEPSSEKDENLNKSALNTTSTTLKYKSDNQSESEAWSEPDRTVSRARIGLETSVRTTPSKKTVSNTSTDSTEEEANRSTKSSGSKKGILNESRNTILELHNQVCDLDQRLNEKEIAFYEATKANGKLRQELANLEIKLEDTEAKLRDAENKKIAADARVQELVETLAVKDSEVQGKVKQIENALMAAQQAQNAAKFARDEMHEAEHKLKKMQQEMSELEDSLRLEYENQLVERTNILESESLKKIDQIQAGAELEIKSLHNTIQQLQMDFFTNYVKKCEAEEAYEQVERLKLEIVGLEEHIEELKEEEQRDREKLARNEEKINALRSDLDNATLQYSEAVLEKTRIANEKAMLETEVGRNILKEVDTKKRLDEVEKELQSLRQTHHKQVSSLQTHKSQLEVRISELESSNAELHNRLIKIQAGCGDHVSSSTSLPSTPNFVNQIVSFRRQHSDNSGYLSEDHLAVDGSRSFNRLAPSQNFDIERNEANSSPDLGIESDHGRFSSLETHVNVHRPLLQTLELTESMSNLLDFENNQVEANCGNANCCQKMVDMAHEITDLKRELLRKRRALEETVTQLTLANQRKKQVEKKICKQIHKTSQVLRKAKANLDSGSETDVYKK